MGDDTGELSVAIIVSVHNDVGPRILIATNTPECCTKYKKAKEPSGFLVWGSQGLLLQRDSWLHIVQLKILSLS